MIKIEAFIKTNAPGSLYGEWAKKEDCWIKLRDENFNIDLSLIKSDLISGLDKGRNRKTRNEVISEINTQNIIYIKSIPSETWKKIYEWASSNEVFSSNKLESILTTKDKLIKNRDLTENDIKKALEIINTTVTQNPEILFIDTEDKITEIAKTTNDTLESEIITIEVVKSIISWNRRNKKLKDYEIRFLIDLSEGKKSLTPHNRKIAYWNYQKVCKYGFQFNFEEIN